MNLLVDHIPVLAYFRGPFRVEGDDHPFYKTLYEAIHSKGSPQLKLGRVLGNGEIPHGGCVPERKNRWIAWIEHDGELVAQGRQHQRTPIGTGEYTPPWLAALESLQERLTSFLESDKTENLDQEVISELQALDQQLQTRNYVQCGEKEKWHELPEIEFESPDPTSPLVGLIPKPRTF